MLNVMLRRYIHKIRVKPIFVQSENVNKRIKIILETYINFYICIFVVHREEH